MTATGLDQIPAWFLRLGAPIFAAPLARLFDQSLTTGVVPRQWKTAVILPIPKTASPTQASDFRPISITPVLSRTLERLVVRAYIYPALLQPCPSLDFSDQFAFRPSRRRLLLWRCCTPFAQCWLRMISCMSSPSISRSTSGLAPVVYVENIGYIQRRRLAAWAAEMFERDYRPADRSLFERCFRARISIVHLN